MSNLFLGYYFIVEYGLDSQIEPWHEFPTMWYMRPAKPQISLRIRAV